VSAPTSIASGLLQTYRRLDPALLTAEDASPPDELSLEGRESRTGLVFGTYTRAGLENALRAYGTLGRLEARGLGPLEVRLDMTDPFRPRVRLECGPYGGRPCLDVELRETSGSAFGLGGRHSKTPVLYLEGLLLQHPGKRFDWSRPPLPQQEFPGLALSGEILQLLLLLAKRIGAEALMLRPSTFHAAWIYARYFRFVDGRAQGRLETLLANRHLRPLWLLSWALELGCVRRDGEPVGFGPDPMAAPLTRMAGFHFQTRAWKRGHARGRAERYALDVELLRERFPWSQMPEGPPPTSVLKLLRPR
jgi:hypothetical protein